MRRPVSTQGRGYEQQESQDGQIRPARRQEGDYSPLGRRSRISSGSGSTTAHLPDLAYRHHDGHPKGASVRSRSHLGAAGLVTSKSLYRAGPALLGMRRFASRAIMKVDGGRLSATGAKRSEVHELMTTRAYHALGQPADFRLASNLAASDIRRGTPLRPDALYKVRICSRPSRSAMVRAHASSHRNYRSPTGMSISGAGGSPAPPSTG